MATSQRAKAPITGERPKRHRARQVIAGLLESGRVFGSCRTLTGKNGAGS